MIEDLRIELAKEVGARMAAERDLKALQERLQEPYVDEHGGTWIAPTAEAYYLVCRARAKWQDRAIKFQAQVDEARALLLRNFDKLFNQTQGD